ncbi:7208_t:CDS:1, partial [Gigaspora rosea]
FSDNATPPSDTQIIFKDMKIQQAPFLIPPIYPGARFIIYCILEKGVDPCKEIILSAISQDGPIKLSIPLDPVALQGTKIHTLAAKNLFKILKKEIRLFICIQEIKEKDIRLTYSRTNCEVW